MTYDTNLASEYFILSALYRKGFEAFITLGNKKSIDIIVKHHHRQVTIDVKGMKGTTSFPIDNLDITTKDPNHYIIFISFLNRIDNIESIPEIYIVPLSAIKKLMYQNPKGNRRVVNLSKLRKNGIYRDNWDIIK
ncbi:MAG TPA: hypothetical protein VKG26_11660 [Bacteroidia bacterium]|nr:hypothetical protein [Bacteroidia bacterium]